MGTTARSRGSSTVKDSPASRRALQLSTSSPSAWAALRRSACSSSPSPFGRSEKPRRGSPTSSKPSRSASRATRAPLVLVRAERDGAREAPFDLGDQVEEVNQVPASGNLTPVVVEPRRRQELVVDAGEESIGLVIDVLDDTRDRGDASRHLHHALRSAASIARAGGGRAGRREERSPPTALSPLTQPRARSQSSIRRRAIESFGGRRTSCASTWSRWNQRASSSSPGGTFTSPRRAVAQKPSMIEEGKGHGCDEWYSQPSMAMPASSITSRATASSRLSPGSTKPASAE